MAYVHPAWEEHQRRRWTRPDGDRYLKPDPERWLSPEEPRLEYPELYERKYGSLLRSASRPPPPSTLDTSSEDESLRRELIAILRDFQVRLTELKHALVLRRKYRPDQPRVPAGNPDGGQWTHDSAGSMDGRAEFDLPKTALPCAASILTPHTKPIRKQNAPSNIGASSQPTES